MATQKQECAIVAEMHAQIQRELTAVREEYSKRGIAAMQDLMRKHGVSYPDHALRAEARERLSGRTA